MGAAIATRVLSSQVLLGITITVSPVWALRLPPRLYCVLAALFTHMQKPLPPPSRPPTQTGWGTVLVTCSVSTGGGGLEGSLVGLFTVSLFGNTAV